MQLAEWYSDQPGADANDTSLSFFLDCFDAGGGSAKIYNGHLMLDGHSVPIKNGIPRFTRDVSYSSGNFSLLRERHAALQLDSRNGTTERLDTLLARTQWPRDFFKGKLVLECGCGVGPDTEILLALGARVVAADLAGLDITRANLGNNPNLCLIQADIMNLPLRPQSFDIIFCHRVLQHTPDPRRTLDHILRFAKPGAAAFIHSYARNAHQMLRWKYALRPLTKRLPPEMLYKVIEFAAPALFRLTSVTGKTRAGRRLNWVFVPFLNHRHKPKFAGASADVLLEHGIHDTFDALSPPYDEPLAEGEMSGIASRHLNAAFEITTAAAVTLLRSRLS